MGHGFNPLIVIHTSQKIIMDYPITGYIEVEISSVVGALVHHN